MIPEPTAKYVCVSCWTEHCDGAIEAGKFRCLQCSYRGVALSTWGGAALAGAASEVLVRLTHHYCKRCRKREYDTCEGWLRCRACAAFVGSGTLPSATRGWVYAMSNPVFPGLFKVGYSGSGPVARARELTAAP